jgi:hypothetical protein
MPKLVDEQEVVCMKRMLVDKRIKPLIDWLNAVPNIITLYSCSGHPANHWALEKRDANGNVIEICRDGGRPYCAFIVTCERFNPSAQAVFQTLIAQPWVEDYHLGIDKKQPLYNSPIAIYFKKVPSKKMLARPLMQLIGEKNVKD